MNDLKWVNGVCCLFERADMYPVAPVTLCPKVRQAPQPFVPTTLVLR